jgi:pimeloyl-ACP methyl ester carboxylesterase
VESPDVTVVTSGPQLPGDLTLPEQPRGAVLFAHGSGSSRRSPRNQVVATSLAEQGFATLLFDLLTPTEADDRRRVFDIPLLASRLTDAVGWLDQTDLGSLPVGLFGASTGAAAALVAAAALPTRISAVVSRGGRPDLAGETLSQVAAPTLLIVGERDTMVLDLNREAALRLRGPVETVVVPGATHLFEEPGALDQVAQLAAAWFRRYLG